jgi:nesprin-1
MKFEFLLDQDAFALSARDINNQLVAEQQALSLNGANSAQLLEEHLSWFGMSARPIVNRARVLVERLEHTAACIPDLEIQQAFENIRNQWNTLMQRADWLLCQLQAIPQKWCEYETNFEDMVKWMNTVDKSVASMSVDAKSLENFNRLREEFKVQTSITEKLELLLTIQQEVSELLTMQSSANPSDPPLTSQRLLGVDVAGLRNTISQMKVAVQE